MQPLHEHQALFDRLLPPLPARDRLPANKAIRGIRALSRLVEKPRWSPRRPPRSHCARGTVHRGNVRDCVVDGLIPDRHGRDGVHVNGPASAGIGTLNDVTFERLAFNRFGSIELHADTEGRDGKRHLDSPKYRMSDALVDVARRITRW